MGPDTIDAGATQEFALVGFDSAGREMPLARTDATITAGTRAGEVLDVRYIEWGVSGNRSVRVVAGPFASNQVAAQGPIVARSSFLASWHGIDAYGNRIDASDSTGSFASPALAGPTTLCVRPGCFEALVVEPVPAAREDRPAPSGVFLVPPEEETSLAPAIGAEEATSDAREGAESAGDAGSETAEEASAAPASAAERSSPLRQAGIVALVAGSLAVLGLGWQAFRRR